MSPTRRLAEGSGLTALTLAGSALVLGRVDAGAAGLPDLLLVAVLAVLAWLGMGRLADAGRAARLVPALFGLGVLFAWEAACRGFAVPPVLLPPPSAVAATLAARAPVLAADFWQTVVRGMLPGYALGCGAGFLAAVLVDRVPFLERGLLPLGNLVAALPIVAVAPIMVMWFGFDWPSKAATVVAMTFFPTLVNALAGLKAAGRLELDLMRSYAAGPWRTLRLLRLPASLPFLFNALKINATLALIGAIVAEFFGTPVLGLGFRISTEAARMSLDVVWAAIAVAAATGSALYGLLTLLERACTFWHPSQRG